MLPWDGLIPEDDRRVIEAAGYGGRMEWGPRLAVAVIDCTRSFLGEPGVPLAEAINRWPNACGPQSWEAVAAIARLLEAAREREIPVFYTVGGFREDGWNLGSWRWKQPRSQEDAKSSPPAKGGNEIVAPLQPRPNDVILSKLKPSGFFETSLRSLLQLSGADTLIVTGGTTSGCVRATATDAFSHNLRVIIPHECCFDRVRVSHAISLFDLNAKYADVVPLDEVIDHIRRTESAARGPSTTRRTEE